MANGYGYTQQGVKDLSGIIKQARGHMSYREFEAYLTERLAENGINGKVPHTTLRRIEMCDFSPGFGPDYDTLAKLAYVTPYTIEELSAIVRERSLDMVRTYRVAEDVIPSIRELPQVQRLRLIQMIAGEMIQDRGLSNPNS